MKSVKNWNDSEGLMLIAATEVKLDIENKLKQR
jgi:hypothetical protein